MSTVVTLELPDNVYEPLAKVAKKAGLPLEEWILVRLRAYAPRMALSEQERAEALARLMRYAGAVNLGYPTGADNESIDADLARVSLEIVSYAWGSLMVTRTQAREILEALSTLPTEKVAEVYDFITFLQERYGKRTAVDVSDAWNEEDLHDLIRASLAHAERTIWAGEEEYG